MFAGFATLGDTPKGAFIIKNWQESPINADSPPIFKVTGRTV